MSKWLVDGDFCQGLFAPTQEPILDEFNLFFSFESAMSTYNLLQRPRSYLKQLEKKDKKAWIERVGLF
jgi:hypothetical protein